MRRVLFIFIILLLVNIAPAAVIHIPVDQPTIQSGIIVAGSHDTVLVAPGTYSENIDFSGKIIQVISTNGAKSTILTPNNPALPAVTIINGEASGTLLKGFTISGGTADNLVYVKNGANPEICYNIFTAYAGTGVNIRVQSNAAIHHNLFYNNAGHSCIALNGGGSANIYNNTMHNNVQGIHTIDGGGTARNNIISQSSGYGIYGIWDFANYNCVYDCNPNYTNGAVKGDNDVNSDPLFIDPSLAVFYLQATSPCIDAGDPDTAYYDPNGSRSDMGAFYFDRDPDTLLVPLEYATIQDALDAAYNGDEIWVSPGDYDHILVNKTVSIVATQLNAVTIHGDSNHRGITVINTADTVHLGGLNVADGVAPDDIPGNWGGGILIYNSSAIITDCNIYDNSASGGYGGGIVWSEGSFVELKNSSVYNNSADYGGGIMSSSGASGGILESNLIYKNAAVYLGGGIYLTDDDFHGAAYKILGNTIVDNSSGTGGAGAEFGNINLTLVNNNIIAFNDVFSSSPNKAGVWCENIPLYNWSCNDVFANCAGQNYGGLSLGGNDLHTDPRFCDTASSDYHLAVNSPCLRAGSCVTPLIGVLREGCEQSYRTWYVATDGNDATGDGSQINPFATIQAGINASLDGDTVLVADGTYDQRIDFLDKAIYLTSINGAEYTELTYPVTCDTLVSITGGQDSTTTIDGFTFANISHNDEIIAIVASSVRIFNCRFLNNLTTNYHSDIRLIQGGTLVIENCEFRSTLENSGAAIAVLCGDGRIVNNIFEGLEGTGTSGGAIGIGGEFCQSTFLIENNLFLNNHNDAHPGGGLFLSDNLNTLVKGNTFFGNGSPEGGAIGLWFYNSGISIENNIIANSEDYGITNNYGSSATLSCNLYHANAISDLAGDLTYGSDAVLANPLFCNTASGDFTIKNTSPCAPENNSCEVLIGAYGVNCENDPPEIISPNSYTIDQFVNFVFRPEVSDPDGPDTLVSYINYPDWMTPSADSIFGMPRGDDHDTTFVVIISDGFLADTMEVSLEIIQSRPWITEFNIIGEEEQHVINTWPIFSWTYYSPGGSIQDSLELEVGRDNDWSNAEMWDTGPIAIHSISITYDGGPLVDGLTYFLRLRLRNGVAWSEWYEASFRMNSRPTVPILSSPLDAEIITSGTPELTVNNSSDAEGDILTYSFEVYSDTLNPAIDMVAGIAEGDGTTGWITGSLDENKPYFWRSRVFDGYEYSEWTGFASFLVNAVEEAPLAYDLIYPPDTNGSQVYDIPAMFTWSSSMDPDPKDSVYYRLEVSNTENFTFKATYNNIYATSYEVPDLDYNTHYWWRAFAIDTKGNETEGNTVADFRTWVLGDANGDGSANIVDASFIINYIFFSGDVPNPLKAADINGDCSTNVVDASYLINYIFFGGADPEVGCK